VRGRWTDFFGVFGKNPLFIYLLSEIILILCWVIPAGNGQSRYEAINATVFQRLAPGPIGSLLFAFTVMTTCWIVGWYLSNRKIFIKV
jgi:predicted acyltransferase